MPDSFADLGVPGAFKKDPNLIGGLNLLDGKITCRGVAEAHGLELHAPF